MDCLSPSSPFTRVVFVKPAQIGGSELLLNMLGYIIHYAPGPAMLVQPTVELAKRFSRQRVAPLIETTPVLAQRVSDPRERDSANTILAKEFPGGVLVAGANSAVGLRSMPAR
jgi:phage terminase large subunit GpA-like protein